MVREWGIEVVVIKLDEDGCFVATQDTETLVSAYPAGRVVDAIGAGGAFCAGFLGATLMGSGVVEAAKVGNAAAVHMIGEVGGHEKPPTRRDIMTVLEDNGDRAVALSVAEKLPLADS